MLAIGFWFKVDCYFTISLQLFATALYPAYYLDNGCGRRFSLVALVLCVKQILCRGLGYIMYGVRECGVLCNNAVPQVICEV